MKSKFLFFALACVAMLTCLLTGCKEAVTVHCDRCGVEVTTYQDVTEDWILFCKDCEEEIGPIVE